MLILTEKPSVAKDFAVALGASGRKGYYTAGDTVITCCIGHLFELYDPEDYDPYYKKWSVKSLPIVPAQFLYQMNDTTKAQAVIVMDLLKQHKNDDVLVATDAGREGELIARIALQEAGITDISRFRRFWVSEALTHDVILSGIASAKPLSGYDLLSAQGFARQQADWLVGINVTRLMSIGNPPPPFSVGRVQTAVLSCVASRNDEIKNFVPVSFKELEATIETGKKDFLKALLENPKTGKPSFFADDEPYLNAAFVNCADKPFDSVDVESKEKREKPEKLLNITGLQKAAFKQFGYKPEKTLAIAQSLYETHKCLSYPRTPSRVMGDNNVDLFLEKFNLLKDMFPVSSCCDVSLININNKHIFNSAILEDHHALIPLAMVPESATDEERNVYSIVQRSFFTVCMPDYVYNQKSLRFHIGLYTFTVKIREVLQIGFKNKFYADDSPSNDEPEIQSFDEKICTIDGLKVLEKTTQPKKEFALDTLLAFMEHPRGDGEGHLAGLGTPATRADILKTLFSREYLVDTKKKLYVTERGKFLLSHLNDNEFLKKLCDVNTTTEWEERLSADPQAFYLEISDFVRSSIASFASRPVFQKPPVGTCPLCGKPVFQNKAGFGCSGYKDTPKCSLFISKSIAGASVSAADVSLLLLGQKTPIKHCTGKKGKFDTSFTLEGGKIVFNFKK